MTEPCECLPADERGQALDVTALPPWPCCGARGVHLWWCVYATRDD